MVRENPNKESCYERIKELIKEKKSRNQVIQQCQKEFNDVHKTTFYTWYDDVINEEDIRSWEEDNKKEFISDYQIKYNLGQKMFYRNKNMYENLCIKYENNEDDETLEKIEKYEDRLKYFLKK